MILEVAVLDVLPGQEEDFQREFGKAQKINAAMPGYIDHQLQRCIENSNRYLLLVNWNTLEDHTIGFRESDQYQVWRKLLHHYYDPVPTAEHYESVF